MPSMQGINESIFDEWRTADRCARVLEQAHLRAALLALDGRGDFSPTSNDQAQAKRLRVTADDLFKLAMLELDRRATDHRQW